jgi:uncharacterized protein
MQTLWTEKTIKYTGEQLSSLWAYKNFDVQGDSIIAFRGPCDVREHMVDQEDVKNKDFIFSEDMVSFIVEIFDLNLERAIVVQRLLITELKEILEEMVPGISLKREGDDLFDGKNKLSVSIATLSPVSCLIHVGINVSSKNTPVPTKGLNDYDVDPETFANKALQKFREEFTSMENARTKVRGAS